MRDWQISRHSCSKTGISCTYKLALLDSLYPDHNRSNEPPMATAAILTGIKIGHALNRSHTQSHSDAFIHCALRCAAAVERMCSCSSGSRYSLRVCDERLLSFRRAFISNCRTRSRVTYTPTHSPLTPSPEEKPYVVDIANFFQGVFPAIIQSIAHSQNGAFAFRQG